MKKIFLVFLLTLVSVSSANASQMNPIVSLNENERGFVVAIGNDLDINLNNRRGFNYFNANIKPYLENSERFNYADIYTVITEGEFKTIGKSGRSSNFMFFLSDRIVDITNIYYEHNDSLKVIKKEIVPMSVDSVLSILDRLENDSDYVKEFETSSSTIFNKKGYMQKIALKINGGSGYVIYTFVNYF